MSFFLTIWSMHGRSYFTLPTKGWYFPPKVEAFLCTLWTVDHTWQTVDLDLPVHAFFSKNIFFIHPLWCMNGRSLCTLPTKGGPFSLIVDSSLQVDPIPPSFSWFSSPHPHHPPPPSPHSKFKGVLSRLKSQCLLRTLFYLPLFNHFF